MEPQSTISIQDVINNIVTLVTHIAPVAIAVSIGVTQFLKKVKFPSRFVGLLSVVVGFLTGVTIMGLFNGSFFSPLSILVGAIVAFGAPGIYSVASATTTKSPPIPGINQ